MYNTMYNNVSITYVQNCLATQFTEFRPVIQALRPSCVGNASLLAIAPRNSYKGGRAHGRQLKPAWHHKFTGEI